MCWYDGVIDVFGAKQTKPGYWKARCPAHDDRTPSLSLWLGRDGRLLVGCWSGCQLNEVLSAAGVKMGDLFPPEQRNAYTRDGNGKKPVPCAEPKRRIVATFDYTDEDGKLLFQVVRTEPKGFYQRIPDAKSRDGWFPGLRDTRRVLFRLPQIVGSGPSTPIILAEGEGKVLVLEQLGFVGSCNAMGAAGHGEKWLDSYSETLRGRRVVILPDNDRVGIEHAERVAGSLMTHGAAEVRVVMLPGLAEHGDVVNFIAMGKGRQDIIACVSQAVKWLPCKVA